MFNGGGAVPGVNPAEILGRGHAIVYGDPVQDLIRGKRVLVTGAGGSIGAELTRQLDGLGPAELWLLDRDESLMHRVQLELFGHGQLDHERTVLADIRDRSRLISLFRDLRPDFVFHAAAHKHLAILERYPPEAVRTNVLGTENVVLAARAAGVECLILVSTDKAADPSSVLGASKRLAELVVQRAAAPGFRTASVRFGNVLGSRGSFLETLHHQLRTQRTVTITDPLVERYFMTIPEAVSLVVEASALARAGEIYLLDMGCPLRIVDLVRRYVDLLDCPPPTITFTGLVAGEKMSERLLDPSETLEETGHPRIWRVPPADGHPDAVGVLALLYEAADRHDEIDVVSELRRAGFRVGDGDRDGDRTIDLRDGTVSVPV